MKFLVYGVDKWPASRYSRLLGQDNDDFIAGQQVSRREDVLDDLKKHRPDRVVCALNQCSEPEDKTNGHPKIKEELYSSILRSFCVPVFIAQATQSTSLCDSIPVLHILSQCNPRCTIMTSSGGIEPTQTNCPPYLCHCCLIVREQTDLVMHGFDHVVQVHMRSSNGTVEIVSEEELFSCASAFLNQKSKAYLYRHLPSLMAHVKMQKSTTVNNSEPNVADSAALPPIEPTSHNKDVPSDSRRMTHGWLLPDHGCMGSGKFTAEVGRNAFVPEVQSKNIESGAFSVDKFAEVTTARQSTSLNGLINFSRGKLLLVTGGAGFIGSNFINFWAEHFPNDAIVNLDCLKPNATLKNIHLKACDHYCFVHGNLMDQALLGKLAAQYAFTHIIHFAAASNVDHSFQNPVEHTYSNVVGTHCLLEMARGCKKLELFIHISTDEVYGEMLEGDCVEDGAIFRPTNPYSASKAGAECMVMAYAKSYKLPVIITRGNNVYGNNQFPAQAIPRFITALMRNEKMPIHGTGLVTRKFLHVMDKCKAIKILIENGTIGEVYNIGTTNEISVLDLCQNLLVCIKGPHERLCDWITYVADRLYNDSRYSVNTSKIEALGWTPTIPFDSGLAEVVRWYQDNPFYWKP